MWGGGFTRSVHVGAPSFNIENKHFKFEKKEYLGELEIVFLFLKELVEIF